MNIYEYYFELLDKPKYMLSESEKAFIDIFPYVIISAIFIVSTLVILLIELIKGDKK